MEFTITVEYYDLIIRKWFPVHVHHKTNTLEVIKKNVFVTSANESIYIVSISSLNIDLFLLCSTIMYKINCTFKQ